MELVVELYHLELTINSLVGLLQHYQQVQVHVIELTILRLRQATHMQ